MSKPAQRFTQSYTVADVQPADAVLPFPHIVVNHGLNTFAPIFSVAFQTQFVPDGPMMWALYPGAPNGNGEPITDANTLIIRQDVQVPAFPWVVSVVG